ncbi:MAG: hypothetical protein U9R75_00550 [Candidatus Thermoplasmatota archaeon]|nr:hypothetical protein [Candidatus Thermoplasmatota archaeon]
MLIGTSSGDRVLLFLLHRSERSDWSGGRSGQDDISLYCGVGRTHVPRVLKPLLQEGLVEEELGRTPGVSRRVKVYSLTPEGVGAAKSLRSSLEGRELSWKDDMRQLHEGTVASTISGINGTLTRLGMKALPLSLLLTFQKDPITWNDVLWLSSTIRGDGISNICLPDGWTPATPPVLPEHVTLRKDIFPELDSALSGKGIAVLVGKKGMGKRSALEHWIEKRGRKALWMCPSTGDRGISIDEGDHDLVVLLGSDMVDIGSSFLINGRPALRDPRDDGWPKVFFDIPVVGVQDGELDLHADGIIHVTGIDEAPFVENAVRYSISRKLAHELYRAVKGSPGFLEYLSEMDGEDVPEIAGKDLETAVMMFLLGYRSYLDDTDMHQRTHK